MNIDELTQKAQDAYAAHYYIDGDPISAMRAAVLAVLAEVRGMVPAELTIISADPDARCVEAGHNACRAEMLRRLDAVGAPK